MAKRVVILGAGYGGVKCALTLDRHSKKGETEILVIDKNNYHQIDAQLEESALGIRNDGDVRVPLTEIFDSNRIKIITDEVTRIFPHEKNVALKKGSLNYDYLVVGLGNEPDFSEVPGLEQNSFDFRSLNSAKIIRTHIENNLAMFKIHPVKRELLTFVVGGAGFTGFELAGELADWIPILAENYDIPETLMSIVIIEASTAIMTGFDRQLIENSYRVLRDKGVRIITDVSIEGVTENEVRLTNGETVRTGTFIWTGGIRANRVVAQAGFAAAVRGRARVNKYLQAIDFSNVYIIGDNAFITNPETGEVMTPTVQAALRGGYVAARNILADLRGQNPEVFHTSELGRVIALGRTRSLGNISRGYRFRGTATGVLKSAIRWKYLYSLGGFRFVAKKFLK